MSRLDSDTSLYVDPLPITSQHSHRKLHLVALDVIETGELPPFAPLRSPSDSRRQLS